MKFAFLLAASLSSVAFTKTFAAETTFLKSFDASLHFGEGVGLAATSPYTQNHHFGVIAFEASPKETQYTSFQYAKAGVLYRFQRPDHSVFVGGRLTFNRLNAQFHEKYTARLVHNVDSLSFYFPQIAALGGWRGFIYKDSIWAHVGLGVQLNPRVAYDLELEGYDGQPTKAEEVKVPQTSRVLELAVGVRI